MLANTAYRLAFDSPAYLCLLALLPVLWWFSPALAEVPAGRRAVGVVGRFLTLAILAVVLCVPQAGWWSLAALLPLIWWWSPSLAGLSAWRRVGAIGLRVAAFPLAAAGLWLWITRVRPDEPWYPGTWPWRLAAACGWTAAAILPLLGVWLASYRLGRGVVSTRWLVADRLRTVVAMLLCLAAAELQLVKISEKLTVIYVLDGSASIPAERRAAMVEYVNRSILEHRQQDDNVGVIVFGRDAAIEMPPFDDDVQLGTQFESPLNPEFTNLAAALKLALASFPEDAAKRIVIVSDGNENLGNAREQAQAAADAGIGIDVVPIDYQRQAEVLVERVTLPPNVRHGQPFELRVVLNNTSPLPAPEGNISGRLVVTRETGDQPEILTDEHVELPPGKRVFSVKLRIDEPQFYRYKARFVPDDPRGDIPQNNEASTFVHVRGKGKVLFVVDSVPQRKNEHDLLVGRLAEANLEVDVRPSSQFPTNLAELQQYDSVVLANVPREDFTDEQLTMLVENTHSMGAGLIMLGGDNGFGAGGWANSPVEEAMPLDFHIKAAKVVPKGALAMVMHASEMAEGNFWQKVIARKAVEALGYHDYCGVLHLGAGGVVWLWPGGMVKVGGVRDRMLAAIDRMVPGDMPDFDPAMQMALAGFNRVQDAAARHMIVISDGDPTPPSLGMVAQYRRANITVSTVAVGCHGPAESAVLKNLAAATGGKYYEVNNPKLLPKIFQREARRVARPLIHENANGFGVQVLRPDHDIMKGLESVLPPITGYVQTTRKKNELVEVLAMAPEPAGEDYRSIIACWRYGAGKSVAITTDAGQRWAVTWPEWANYARLFSQAVQWSMRPAGDEGKFTVATEVKDGRVRLSVTALDKEDAFLNFLDMHGFVAGPDPSQRIELDLEQVAPGRYTGTFDAATAGSYLVMINPGAGMTPIRTGVDVPYSDEFRARDANVALLKSLAQLRPRGGAAGVVIAGLGEEKLETLLRTNTFRRDLRRASSHQDVWQYLLLVAGCLFFFDVGCRRVAVSFGWVGPVAQRLWAVLLRREPPPPREEYISRLRSRKLEVAQQIESRRAAVRFEPAPDAPATSEILTPEVAAPPPAPPSAPAAGLAPEGEQETYTARLLKAKQRVWKEQKRE